MKMQHAMLGALLAATALTACQQKAYPVYFLTEEDTSGGNSARFVARYNGHTYTRMPFVNQEQLESFHSFMNMQDGSYGVVFTLKNEMRNRLYTTTVQKQGKLILPVVNGLAFQPVRIDRPVIDGKLVIWGGLNGYDLKEMARNIKPEDPELEKKRFLNENPRPLPKAAPESKNDKKDHTGRVIGELISGAS